MVSESESRRRVLQKLGLAGAAAWTAPVVLSGAPASAQAQASPPPGCACGVELVVNGGFEANSYDVPTGWTDTGANNSAAIPWSIISGTATPPPGAGSNVGSLRGFSALRQTIPVDAACAGKTYSFSAYAMAWQGPGEISLAFDGSGTTAWTATLPATSTANATPPRPADVLRDQRRRAGGYDLCDHHHLVRRPQLPADRPRVAHHRLLSAVGGGFAALIADVNSTRSLRWVASSGRRGAVPSEQRTPRP